MKARQKAGAKAKAVKAQVRTPSKTHRHAAHPLEGKHAPDFRLADAAGKEITLGDLTKARALVLYFYPKDMTPGCTAEACAFRDHLSAIQALGAAVAGISGDSADSHRKFTEKNQLNFPLLSDPGYRVARLYGVYRKKTLYGREFMGIERTTFVIGRDGVVRKVFAKVKVNGHAEAVIEAVKELG